jgi:predicted nucleic acid-binding protein
VDPATNEPVIGFRERIDYLVQQLERRRTKIVIPTPALSEILVRSGQAGPEYLSRINSSAVFRVVAFDVRAAVEVAAMTRDAISDGDKRSGGAGTWAKIKYDRQIVAIAKVEGVATIHSDDKNVYNFGTAAGLTVLRIADLPLPPEDAQRAFDFDSRRSNLDGGDMGGDDTEEGDDE